MESLLQRKRRKRQLRLTLVARRRVEMMTKKREMAVEVVHVGLVGAEVDATLGSSYKGINPVA